MRRVLVTGGAGFIGHRLVERLSETDSTVTVVDNLSNANPSFLDTLKGSGQTLKQARHPIKLNKNASVYVADIRDKESVLHIAKREEIDTCIHLAAKISVPDSIRNAEETIDINVKGTLNVLNACSKVHAKKFVFASSSAVYGESDVLPIPEERQLDPLTPYGASKIAGEVLVSSFYKSEKIQNSISLRFFNVFGEGQNYQYAGVITKFAERLSSRLPPVLYGDGTQVRDFIFLEDVVNSILLAANEGKMDEFYNGRIINVGTGKATRIKDLAQNMANLFALDVEPVLAEHRKGDINKSVADISKLTNALGYIPDSDMEMSLKKTFAKQIFNLRYDN